MCYFHTENVLYPYWICVILLSYHAIYFSLLVLTHIVAFLHRHQLFPTVYVLFPYCIYVVSIVDMCYTIIIS